MLPNIKEFINSASVFPNIFYFANYSLNFSQNGNIDSPNAKHNTRYIEHIELEDFEIVRKIREENTQQITHRDSIPKRLLDSDEEFTPAHYNCFSTPKSELQNLTLQ